MITSPPSPIRPKAPRHPPHPNLGAPATHPPRPRDAGCPPRGLGTRPPAPRPRAPATRPAASGPGHPPPAVPQYRHAACGHIHTHGPSGPSTAARPGSAGHPRTRSRSDPKNMLQNCQQILEPSNPTPRAHPLPLPPCSPPSATFPALRDHGRALLPVQIERWFLRRLPTHPRDVSVRRCRHRCAAGWLMRVTGWLWG
jgi:hypothetical protein